MDPNVWGPPLWFQLHKMSFEYPENPNELTRMRAKSRLRALKWKLPCSVCRDHYADHLKKLPLRLSNRRDFVFWVIDLHNSVNRSNNKRVFCRNEAISVYENKLGKDFSSLKEGPFSCMSKPVLLIILLLILFIFITKCKCKN